MWQLAAREIMTVVDGAVMEAGMEADMEVTILMIHQPRIDVVAAGERVTLDMEEVTKRIEFWLRVEVEEAVLINGQAVLMGGELEEPREVKVIPMVTVILALVLQILMEEEVVVDIVVVLQGVIQAMVAEDMQVL